MNDEHIKMLPESLQGTAGQDSKWVDERLEHNKQQRRHKAWIFYTSLFICIAMLSSFCFLVGCSSRALSLIEKSPLAIVLITLMGGIPTILIAVVFKGVFHIPGKDDDVISKKDIETVKEVIMMCKDIAP